MQSIITPEQARQARATLKLSQGRTAAETGLNRTYLSQFESGKMLLSDEQLLMLCQFLEDSGYEFPEVAPSPLRTQPESGCFWERDGVVISCNITEDQAEDLFDEYERLRSRIKNLGGSKN